MLKTSDVDIENFINLANSPLGYNVEAKEKFHRLGKKICKEIANRMGLVSFNIRSNKAGIACSGEITLHDERVYIQFGQSLTGLGFMYRSCKGLTDYSGGQNRWMKYNELRNLDSAIAKFVEARNS